MCVRMAPYTPQQRNYTRDEDDDVVMMIPSWLEPIEENPQLNPPDDEDDYWQEDIEDEYETDSEYDEEWDDPPVENIPVWQPIHVF